LLCRLDYLKQPYQRLTLLILLLGKLLNCLCGLLRLNLHWLHQIGPKTLAEFHQLPVHNLAGHLGQLLLYLLLLSSLLLLLGRLLLLSLLGRWLFLLRLNTQAEIFGRTAVDEHLIEEVDQLIESGSLGKHRVRKDRLERLDHGSGQLGIHDTISALTIT
jgi:hypothetical protein